MMKKNRNILVPFVITLLFLFSNKVEIQGNTTKELIRYNIKYGFINGGEVEFQTNVSKYEDEPVYHTKVDAKTKGFIDQLYKLHDIYESYYDMETGYPKLAIQNLSEGKYRHYDEVRYYQDKFYASSLKRKMTFLLEEPTYDILSAIQYLRNMDWSNLTDGDTVTIITAYDKEPFPIYIVYKGMETLTIGQHKYACHKFAPIIDPGKILKKKESILIWFSDDKNKIPVNVRLNLLIGAFRLELNEADVLPHPFTAKSSKKGKED